MSFNYQVLSNVLAILGGVILAIIWVPQIVKIIKTKSAKDISYTTLLL